MTTLEHLIIQNQYEALLAFDKTMPYLAAESKQVLDFKLNYEALVYHCLRTYGKIPLSQLGTSVSLFIKNPETPLLQDYLKQFKRNAQTSLELTPDIVIFKPKANWHPENPLFNILMAIEIKIFANGTTFQTYHKLEQTLKQLSGLNAEVRWLGSDFLPALMLIDIDITSAKPHHLSPQDLQKLQAKAKELEVYLYYISPHEIIKPNLESDEIITEMLWENTFANPASRDTVIKMAREAKAQAMR